MKAPDSAEPKDATYQITRGQAPSPSQGTLRSSRSGRYPWIWIAARVVFEDASWSDGGLNTSFAVLSPIIQNRLDSLEPISFRHHQAVKKLVHCQWGLVFMVCQSRESSTTGHHIKQLVPRVAAKGEMNAPSTPPSPALPSGAAVKIAVARSPPLSRSSKPHCLGVRLEHEMEQAKKGVKNQPPPM